MTASLQSFVWLADGTGLTPPAEFTAIRERVDTLAAMSRPNLLRLTEAVRTGNGDLATLRSLAISECYTSDIVEQVYAAARLELCSLWEPVGAKNYHGLADRFNDAAKRFTACTSRVDVNAVPAEIIDADSKALAAWKSAAAISIELEDLMMPLACAAELAGMGSDLFAMTFDDNTALIPLCVDVTGQHRRRLWDAWHSTESRCGRWGSLAALGVKIRAASNPEALQLFPPPQLPGVAFVPGPSGTTVEPFDPEDLDQAGVIKRLADAMTGRNSDQNGGLELPS
jgi:hypothetical protein